MERDPPAERESLEEEVSSQDPFSANTVLARMPSKPSLATMRSYHTGNGSKGGDDGEDMILREDVVTDVVTEWNLDPEPQQHPQRDSLRPESRNSLASQQTGLSTS
jgi:hypothetical protein